jgi:hypothetical protein
MIVTPLDGRSRVPPQAENPLYTDIHSRFSSAFICLHPWIDPPWFSSVLICVHPWFRTHL